MKKKKKKKRGRRVEAVNYCHKRWPFSSVGTFTTAVEAYLAGARNALRQRA